MNSSPLAAIWHWYPLLAWVACARFCSLPLGSLSYLNFYLKLRLDSNFSYGTGLNLPVLVFLLLWAQGAARYNSLPNLGIFRDQAWVRGLTINKPDQFLNFYCFLRVSTI